MKFKINKKGKITQWFNGNSNPLYKNAGLDGHTGIDWRLGYGKRVTNDSAGYVYKTMDKAKGTQGASGFTGVYQLIPVGGDIYMEILYGHLSVIYVNEGDTIPENYVIGREGNNGDVYSKGIYYPDGHPDKGEKGSHVHEQWRPVKRVKELKSNTHYLGKAGGRYQDNEGYYYEVLSTNNLRGCIDPMVYKHVETVTERINAAYKVIAYLLAKYKK